MTPSPSRDSGFSLVELVVVMGIAVVLMAISIPMMNVTDRMRLNDAAREVRQELQTARLKAVSINRSLEVRFNCPANGEYRIVEAGPYGSTNRCDGNSFPYPAPADAPYQTPPKPRYDGPIRRVHPRVNLNPGDDPTLILRFAPNGQVFKVVGSTATLIASQNVTVAIGGLTRTMNVNAFGKILLQQ
jgi:prepilin-type N-terminal cleavage/methylation domain-containing protein